MTKYTPQFRANPNDMVQAFGQPSSMSQLAGNPGEMVNPDEYYRKRMDSGQGFQENPYMRFSQLAGVQRLGPKMGSRSFFQANQQESAIKNIPYQAPAPTQAVSTQVMPQIEFNPGGISYNRGWY